MRVGAQNQSHHVDGQTMNLAEFESVQRMTATEISNQNKFTV